MITIYKASIRIQKGFYPSNYSMLQRQEEEFSDLCETYNDALKALERLDGLADSLGFVFLSANVQPIEIMEPADIEAQKAEAKAKLEAAHEKATNS